MTLQSKPPDDESTRNRALTSDESFVVRAPAGSGKTELLTRRFLRLLATVDEPEEILAITFTRAATAEMRGRVLRELERAERADVDSEVDEALLLGRAALAQSELRGWNLLNQPHRLRIETIDSLCLRIAHKQPFLSRMGGALSPTENSSALYDEAAQRTLSLLGSQNAGLHQSIEHFLDLRDNNVANCKSLLAGMLSKRDQWIHAFPFVGSMDEDEWDQVRSHLEQPFRNAINQATLQAHEILTRESTLTSEMLHLAHYAASNGNNNVAILSGLKEIGAPGAMMLEHWRAVCDLLLTKDCDWRKPGGLNRNCGFPANTPDQKEMKRRMSDLLMRLQELPTLLESLCALRELPKPRYEDGQWATLRHIFTVLRRAVAELRVLFAERNKVDFIEIGLAAHQVLANADLDTLLTLSGGLRHILVDEFQDTSRAQHDLLCLLVRAWEQSDGRTCFLVGDPMQSIYMFRQAEVELFAQVMNRGLVSPEHFVNLDPLELTCNFRSHEGLTTRWNEIFSAVFAPERAPHALRIKYSHSYAKAPKLSDEGVFVYPQFVGTMSQVPTQEERRQARQKEAEQVLGIIERYSQQIEEAKSKGESFQIAVLARTRAHLVQIVFLLREHGILYRAVELETLGQRQELIDLMSLTRALLHPMDRIAWLATLRAPWCGLSLADLHSLTGSDDPDYRNLSILELIATRLPYLTPDGQARLKRVSDIMRQALRIRFAGPDALSLSQWIERTWRSLGGGHCLDKVASENAEVFFALLDNAAPDGISCVTEDFDYQMERLFAQPDPQANEHAGLQLMTIHKAKGLGFDVVIVPGLDRKQKRDDPPLVTSLRRSGIQGEDELLVVPMSSREDEKHPTYIWVQKQRQLRALEELKRVFYVACTRARRSLHLLGTAKVTPDGVRPEHTDSLLAAAWPGLAPDFQLAFSVPKKPRTAEPIPFPAQAAHLNGLDLAAGAAKPLPFARLRRLRVGADLSISDKNVPFAIDDAMQELPLKRPQGSREARIRGNVVHALLQQLSSGGQPATIASRARTLLRAAGYSSGTLDVAVADAVRAIDRCQQDPDGAWILAPHASARSESSWTGLKNGVLQTLRADRIFVAGSEPQAPGSDHLWIIDYKMSSPSGSESFLEAERSLYAPQLARYARAVRDAEGTTLPIRLGLYYPRIALLDWWPEEQMELL